MAEVPFPVGLEETENLPRTRRALQNIFHNGNNRVISRPGITQLNTTSRVARGSFIWNGSLYHVASGDLLKFTNLDTGAFSDVGNIADPFQIRTAVGFNHVVIVVRGGNIYTVDTSDVVTDITGNANFKTCVDVAHIDGRFVYIPEDGSPAFFSDVGAAGTVQATSFFDAESLPDKNNAVFNFDNTLYIMGENSIEPFRPIVTSAAVPFARIPGARIDKGHVGGKLEYNERFLFIGRESGQDLGIFEVREVGTRKISNEAIDKILTTYTEAEIAEAIPGRVKWRGYDFATFSLRRDSFGYYAGNWFRLDTILSGLSRPWGGGYISSINNKYYTAFSDKIGRFGKVNTDYGERITRIIDLGFEQENREQFSASKAELGIAQGFNDGVGSVGLAMSRNNVEYSPMYYRPLGAIGQYGKKLEWNPPGGLGNYDGFMGMRFYTTENVDFNCDFVTVDFG